METNETTTVESGETAVSPQKRGDWRRILPGVIISIISLVVVFYFADLQELREALVLADTRLIVLGAVLIVVWLFVRGLFWRTLLQDKAAYRDVFWTLNEGYLINNLLPFRLGEIARAFLLSKKSGMSFWEVLPSILIERIMDITYAIGLFFLLLPFVVGISGQGSFAVVMGIGILLVFLVLFLLARNRDWALKVNDKIGERVPIIRRLTGKIVPSFLTGLAVLTDGRRFLTAVGWVTLDWAIAFLEYFVLVRAFVPDAKPLWSSFSLVVAALGIAVPSSPGGVGVFEAAIVGALALFGVNSSAALAAAITAHVIQYAVTGVLGMYALIRDGESLTGLYRRVRSMPPEVKV
ncbi:MAG: lysylphosphatidylglycerol synthase transmembrane domain-containing protein [Anaerolineales bacterium]